MASADLFIPVFEGEALGIGTKRELEALIAEGILPSGTALLPMADPDVAALAA